MIKSATGMLDDDDDRGEASFKSAAHREGLNGKFKETHGNRESTQNDDACDELITPRQFAGLLKVSLRTLWRLVSTGKAPRPLKLHGSTRWQRSVVTKWIQGGCRPQ